jgi:hypothetical protein
MVWEAGVSSHNDHFNVPVDAWAVEPGHDEVLGAVCDVEEQAIIFEDTMYLEKHGSVMESSSRHSSGKAPH